MNPSINQNQKTAESANVVKNFLQTHLTAGLRMVLLGQFRHLQRVLGRLGAEGADDDPAPDGRLGAEAWSSGRRCGKRRRKILQFLQS